MPFTIWLTGWSGSGKSTIANWLQLSIPKSVVVDGDQLRADNPRPLGFSKEDRDQQVADAINLSGAMMATGQSPIVALISPYRDMRELAKAALKPCVEVYVKCGRDELILRDTKGLYDKALRGEITNLTGINDPYEEPEHPDVVVETDKEDVRTSVLKIINHLMKEGIYRGEDG